ncbi:hypothetical protein LCGC14_2467880, partial [marine sediment metagenome]
MGTFDLVRGTRNPLWVELFWKVRFWLEGLEYHPIGGAEGEGTFTQEQVNEKVTAAVAEANSGAGDFYKGFAPEIKNHPTITRYKSVEELAKGHLEMEKTVGLKGVLIPAEGSSDDVKAKYFKAIGRPDIADTYSNPELSNLHEGIKSISEVDVKGFKSKAFELGLSEQQFKGILDWHLGLSSQRLTEWDKTQKDDKDAASTALRNT